MARYMSEAAREHKRQYDLAYRKEHVKKRVIDFNEANDEDMKILEHLDGQRNKSRYVKDLIKSDMAGE